MLRQKILQNINKTWHVPNLPSFSFFTSRQAQQISTDNKKIKYFVFFETVFVRSSTLCVLRQIFSQLLQDLGNKENLSKSLSKADPKKFKIYYCLEFIRMHNKESGQI